MKALLITYICNILDVGVFDHISFIKSSKLLKAVHFTRVTYCFILTSHEVFCLVSVRLCDFKTLADGVSLSRADRD